MNLLKFTLLCYVIAAPVTNVEDSSPTPTGEASFEEFLDLFAEVDLPYQIDFLMVSDNFKKAQEKKTLKDYYRKGKRNRGGISKDQLIMMQYIRELERASFSRMGPRPYNAVAKVEIDDQHIGVIYALEAIYSSYYMTIFNKKGKELETSTIARFTRKTNTQCTIKPDKTFEIKTYKNIWLKDLKKGLENNEVIGSALEETKICSIDSKGKFVETVLNSNTDRAFVD